MFAPLHVALKQARAHLGCLQVVEQKEVLYSFLEDIALLHGESTCGCASSAAANPPSHCRSGRQQTMGDNLLQASGFGLCWCLAHACR